MRGLKNEKYSYHKICKIYFKYDMIFFIKESFKKKLSAEKLINNCFILLFSLKKYAYLKEIVDSV